MTLKRAKLIAALIADLDKDCEYTDFVAEVELRPYCECDYSVKLYSKAGSKNQLCDLTLFARALDLLGTSVHLYFSSHYVELS